MLLKLGRVINTKIVKFSDALKSSTSLPTINIDQMQKNIFINCPYFVEKKNWESWKVCLGADYFKLDEWATCSQRKQVCFATAFNHSILFWVYRASKATHQHWLLLLPLLRQHNPISLMRRSKQYFMQITLELKQKFLTYVTSKLYKTWGTKIITALSAGVRWWMYRLFPVASSFTWSDWHKET